MSTHAASQLIRRLAYSARVGTGFAKEYAQVIIGGISCGKPVPTLPENALEALLERTCLARRLAGTGAECGVPAAELLPAVSLVVARRDQGGVSRSRQHRRALRPRGAQPELRDPASERGVAQILRQADHPPGLHPVQRVPARPLHLPVLPCA